MRSKIVCGWRRGKADLEGMIAVAIPSAYEAGPFVQNLQNRKGFRVGALRGIRGTLGGKTIVVGLIKIGQPHAATLTELLLKKFKPEHLILAGFAGGLDPELPRGKVVCCHGEGWQGLIHTATEVVATPEDKARLWEETGCWVVDMECEAVAAKAAEAGVSFSVLRVVSDTAGDAVPNGVLSRGYDQKRGKETPLRLGWYLCRHPSAIGVLMGFLRMTEPSRIALAEALIAYFREAGLEVGS